MATTSMMDMTERELNDREQARKRVQRKHKFRGDVVAYVVINAFLIGIWRAVTGHRIHSYRNA